MFPSLPGSASSFQNFATSPLTLGALVLAGTISTLSPTEFAQFGPRQGCSRRFIFEWSPILSSFPLDQVPVKN